MIQSRDLDIILAYLKKKYFPFMTQTPYKTKEDGKTDAEVHVILSYRPLGDNTPICTTYSGHSMCCEPSVFSGAY